MTLLRTVGRTLLASYFVASGVKAVANPDPLVPAAEPLADKVVPLVKQYAPTQVARYVPEDAKTLVRVNGAAQIVGGLALATGFGRRLGALVLAATIVPSTLAKYPFWTRGDRDERASDREHFLMNASLLGGVLIAAGDTEGKPSLAYRAQKGSHALAKDTRKASKRVAKSTGRLTDAAIAEGALLVGTVVAQSRKARKKAQKQAAKARKAAKPALKRAESAAKDAQKQLEKVQRSAGKKIGGASDNALKKAEDLQKTTVKRVAELQKEVGKQARSVRKSAADVASNITLGDN